MADSRRPTRLQSRIGILIAGMAAAVAVAPLALAIAVRTQENSVFTTLLAVASVLWLIAFVIYRALASAYEKWRRNALRREIADVRRARIETSEAFQDTLNEQAAILMRVEHIAESLLAAGIVDPITTLEQIRLIRSHANEAVGLVEDAIAEVRVETGSAQLDIAPIELRAEVEDIAAPFIRTGATVTTTGSPHYAETDAAVFRLIVRNLLNLALSSEPTETDVSLARDGDRVVCTVADNGLDQSLHALDQLPPVAAVLATAISTTIEFGRALGWNRYSFALPAAPAPGGQHPDAVPMDVLGEHRPLPAPPPPERPRRRRIDLTESIPFDEDDAATDRRESTVAG